MEARDEILISYDQNPAVADAVKNLKPGDSLELKAMTKVKAINQDSCTLVVDAYIPNGYEVKSAEEKSPAITGTSSQPILNPTAAMVGQKT